MESIVNFLENNFGISFTVGVCLVGAIIFFVWWSRGVWDKIKELPCEANNKEIETHKCQLISLPCESHKEKINAHKELLDEHDEKERKHQDNITEITTSLKFIKQMLDNLNNQRVACEPYTETNSPLQITEKGQSVANLLKLEEAVLKGWDDISVYISESIKDMNAYDIQQFCLEQTAVYPEKFFKDVTDLDRVKLHAYNEGLTLSPYMRIIAVIIRDKYFNENNIPLEHVDENNPNYND